LFTSENKIHFLAERLYREARPDDSTSFYPALKSRCICNFKRCIRNSPEREVFLQVNSEPGAR
ncbi:hypothetical protein AVEN_114048-1, partial [Araneus ventricosus]